MLDFFEIMTRKTRNGVEEIYPEFIMPTYHEITDLMIRGGDFYAIWNEDEKCWSTDENVALYLIDRELYSYAEKRKQETQDMVKVLSMRRTDSKMLDKWRKYVQKHLRDSYHPLDERIIFADAELKKEDYASRKLKYPLVQGDYKAYDELMNVLYSPQERAKIEWAIGAIISGDSKEIQKFLVLYGSAGTGKSTVLNIIQALFDGYYSVFDAKSLGNPNSTFALEPFRTNPLVAIQHDGDLSRIEDNTRLNSIVSHEEMTVNEKFKATYIMRFNSFLLMGTNRPVKITDAKSGILRRLIDVTPTGNKVKPERYKALMNQIGFELSGIASHCLEVYEQNKGMYDNYIPTSMMGASNDFYNFVLDSYDIFEKRNSTTLKDAWELYDVYCRDSKIEHPFTKRIFKEELKNYFKEFFKRTTSDDGERIWNFYEGFMTEKFEYEFKEPEEQDPDIMELKCITSTLDDILKDCPAQYASEKETPICSWDKVTTKLSDLDTTKLHYVRVPENHIVIDFDIKDAEGNKSLYLNLLAASQWPATYAEFSKGGNGIHLHYIYNGDVSKLNAKFDENVEVKVFTGKSSLRRRLSFCNNLPILTISSGLPLKGAKKMAVKDWALKDEEHLINRINKALRREVGNGKTKPTIDFIYSQLEQAYESGMVYDVSEMEDDIRNFAIESHNNMDYCLEMVRKMKFASKQDVAEISRSTEIDESKPILIFDCEVGKNVFVLVWKAWNEGAPVIWINPTKEQIDWFIEQLLAGYNCKHYDNHVIYAAHLGWDNYKKWEISYKIINKAGNGFFPIAYGLSYIDIYEMCTKKQSLKKWEIELKLPHQEMDVDWNEDIPEELWDKLAEYCVNDVLATEAVLNANMPDYLARQILATLAGGIVNDSTNALTTKLILEGDPYPQKQFYYRDLSKPVHEITKQQREFLELYYPEVLAEPFGEAKSILPYWDGYVFQNGKSTYRGRVIGEGGNVFGAPGMYWDVLTNDVASMHPTSMLVGFLLGMYSYNLRDLRQARIYIKHKDYESAGKLFDGKLKPYLTNEKDAKALSSALKLAINSVYGLTAAKFSNPFKDPRNVDNIVAKMGALFMSDLQYEVEKRGGTVVHIKTDSIKLLKPTPELQEFVLYFGKRHGYTFEIEHHFEKICLVNNAVYIAKCADDDPECPGQWTATGTQFAVPYVFKTLFSKEPLEFEDLCETKTVTTSMYLDMNEDLPEGEHDYHFIGKVGSFCPIKEGCGGGVLLRKNGDKYDAVGGTKGYRWMEASMVEQMNKQDDIDLGYYDRLVDEAVATISEFGDFEKFIND